LAGSLQLNINLVAPTLYCMKVRFTPILFFSLAVFVGSCKLDPVIYPGQPGYVDTAPKTSGGTTGTTSGTGSSGSTTGSGTGNTTGSGSTSGSGSGTSTGGSTGSGSGTTTGSGSGTSISNSGLSGTWKITSVTDIIVVNGSTTGTTSDPTIPSLFPSITLDDNAKTATAADATLGGNTVPTNYTTSTLSGNNYIQFASDFLEISSGTQVHILSMTSTSMTWQFVLGTAMVNNSPMETDVKIIFSKQ
jgi:hypothetical protein